MLQLTLPNGFDDEVVKSRQAMAAVSERVLADIATGAKLGEHFELRHSRPRPGAAFTQPAGAL